MHPTDETPVELLGGEALGAALRQARHDLRQQRAANSTRRWKRRELESAVQKLDRQAERLFWKASDIAKAP